MAVVMAWAGDGIVKLESAAIALGSQAKAARLYSMALNKTGGIAFTRVKRAVAGQMGISIGGAVRYGGLKRISANAGRLETVILASGGAIPTKEFRARQASKGISAQPWAVRRIFKRTFFVASIGGHVFKRTKEFNEKSGRFNAIEKHWGPAVPKEIVKDASKREFDAVAARMLPVEVARLIRVMTKGAVS